MAVIVSFSFVRHFFWPLANVDCMAVMDYDIRYSIDGVGLLIGGLDFTDLWDSLFVIIFLLLLISIGGLYLISYLLLFFSYHLRYFFLFFLSSYLIL